MRYPQLLSEWSEHAFLIHGFANFVKRVNDKDARTRLGSYHVDTIAEVFPVSLPR